MKSSLDYFSCFIYNFINHLLQIFITILKIDKDKTILSKIQQKIGEYFLHKKIKIISDINKLNQIIFFIFKRLITQKIVIFKAGKYLILHLIKRYISFVKIIL